jgi:two-component system, cell cycle response regulator
MDEDDPLVALRSARSRFIAGFHGQCDSLEVLTAAAAPGGTTPERTAARKLVHRIVGLAGTIGFKSLSIRAAELESLLASADPYDPNHARALTGALREAFTADLAAPPDWAVDPATPSSPLTILLVEDDAEQRSVVGAYLRAAGHTVQELGAGDQVLDHVRQQGPSLVLLDVEMPGLNGFSVCRLLKADPELSSIPVIIITTRDALDDRMTGLTLGADEFLSKPVDLRELLLRIQRIAGRLVAGAESRAPADLLGYPAFVAAARGPISAGPGTIALVRVPAGPGQAAALDAFRFEVRRRDVVGRYNDSHLVLLLPGMTAAAARDRLRDVLRTMGENGHTGLAAGVAGAAGGAATVEGLVAEADEALAQARVSGDLAATRSARPAQETARRQRRLVLADDDPEVARIVDAHMRAEGFSTTLAFDGQQAVEAVEREQPDVLILDLMMPKMTGFDVLHRLRALAVKPRVIVLSARGREQDVTRAFDLGADDYMMKPFSPQELRARIGRLLR